jgi:hypothetical protein
MFIRERMIAKKKADQKPATSNPCTILDVKRINSPFITSENNPIVKILIGRVSINIIGLINIFISAHTIARTKAPIKVTSTPGNKYAATPIAIAEIIQCFIFFISLL